MGDLNGTNIMAKIVPFNSKDEYPTHEDIYGCGGHMSVVTISERNSIPRTRRKIGMSVFVLDTGITYRLISNPSGSTSDADWRNYQDVNIINLDISKAILEDGNWYKSSGFGNYEITMNCTDTHGHIIWYLAIDTVIPSIKFNNDILWRYTDDLTFDSNSVNILEFETIDSGKTWLGRSNKFSITLAPTTTESPSWVHM